MRSTLFGDLKIDKFFKDKTIIFAAWDCEGEKNVDAQGWINLLRLIFKSVIIFDPRKSRLENDPDGMRNEFLALIRKEMPDFVFYNLIADELSIETLEAVREISPGTISLNFFGDDDVQFEAFSRFYSLLVDYSLIFQREFVKKYKSEGIKNAYGFIGTDTSTCKPLNLKKEYDVTFIGAYYPDRYKLLKFLLQNGISLNVFGRGWEKFPELQGVSRGFLPPEDFVKVINRSKICINLSKNPWNVNCHIKGRIFEFAACGAFQLVEYVKEYKKLFKRDELVLFKTEEELVKKIKYYLRNEKERNAIARAGLNRVLKEYNFSRVFCKFFEQVHKDYSRFKHQELPKVDKNIEILNSNDFVKGFSFIKNKLRNADYVSFYTSGAQATKYKNYLQAYALEKTEKEISCCEYYIYSPRLGNYLLFKPFKAMHFIPKKELNKMIDINQLMTRRDYFLKNYAKFKRLFYGHTISLISKENTTFIGLPLVRITKYREIGYDDMLKSCVLTFMLYLNSLIFKKKIIKNPYAYILGLEAILGRRKFILRHIKENIRNKLE